MDMIRCPRCAREIPDTSRFCRRCGCAIVWRAELMPPMPPIPQVAPKPTTLKAPVTPRTAKPKACSTGGGGGLFALLALGGMVCFVNYHAVVKPMERPAPRVNFQPIPRFPTDPAHYNYTPTPVRTSPSRSPWLVPPPPMPQPPSVRINPRQGPIYWSPGNQGRPWHDDRVRDNDE
jgi:hypothetical protein